MKKAILVFLLLAPSLCSGQFVSKVGLCLGGGSAKVYGAGLEGAPSYSFVETGAFVDWHDGLGGFKTTALWSVYEGSRFRSGTLSLEFLPKVAIPQTPLWAGAGVYTLLNTVGENGVGVCGEVGWSGGRVMLSARVRHTFSDVSSELPGGQRGLEFGGRVYYSLIVN